jgi:hypothetical protein
MPHNIIKLPSGQWAKKRREDGKIVSRHATKEKAIGSALAVMHAEGDKNTKDFIHTAHKAGR